MVVLQPIKPGSPPIRVGLSLKRGRARRALSLLGNNNTQQNIQLAESLLTISAEEFAHKYNFDPIEGVPLAHGQFQWRPLTPTIPISSTQPPVTLTTPSPEQPHPADDVRKEQTTCLTLPSASSSRHPQVPQSQAKVSPSLAQVAQSQPQVTTGPALVTQNHPQATAPQTSCSSSDPPPSSDSRSRSRETQSEKDQNGNHSVEVNGSPEVKESPAAQAEVRSTVDSVILPDEGKDLSSTTSDEADQALRLRQTSITEYVRPRKLSTFKPSELPSQSTSSSYSKKRPASSLQDQLSQPPHKKLLLHLRA